MAGSPTERRSPVSLCPVQRELRPTCCARLDSTPIRRPDLDIYAQPEIAEAGGVPTWDSPDITTNISGGVWTLLREPRVRIRNVGQASASGVVVEFQIAEFGVGLPWASAASQVATVAVGQEIELRFPLAQAILDAPRQSIGTRVTIQHSADRNLRNNMGEQIIFGLVYTPGTQITDQLTIRNSGIANSTIQLAIADTTGGINANIDNPQVVLGPGAQTTVTVLLQIPASIPPPPPLGHHVTVIAREGGSLYGGVTYILRP